MFVREYVTFAAGVAGATLPRMSHCDRSSSANLTQPENISEKSVTWLTFHVPMAARARSSASFRNICFMVVRLEVFQLPVPLT